jgi:hypothetical protein
MLTLQHPGFSAMAEIAAQWGGFKGRRYGRGSTWQRQDHAAAARKLDGNKAPPTWPLAAPATFLKAATR